jgi:uncharacterized protein (DUF2384 family)
MLETQNQSLQQHPSATQQRRQEHHSIVQQQNATKLQKVKKIINLVKN